MSAVMLLQLGMPVAMAISGIVAWRISRRRKDQAAGQEWRDDSLDAWRQEQAALSERERAERVAGGPPLEESVRAGAEEETEQRRHTRLGG